MFATPWKRRERSEVAALRLEMGLCGAPLLRLALSALLGGCSVSSSHSLRYFHTGVSEPGQGLPWFITLGYVDDQLIAHYDSNTKREQPRAPWMEKFVKDNPQFWAGQTQIARSHEQKTRVNLANVPKYYNQSGGFHTWQWMVGCELRSDRSKGGYEQFGYDGRDYISFNKETLTWTAADVPAQNTKRQWEADRTYNQNLKAYLEEKCIGWLESFLDYGNETLLRTEPPVVKVTSQVDHDGMESLICRAHGFYPKAIDATWRKDGEILEHKTFRRDVAPNLDGTYHTLLSIQIDPKDRGHYRCHVEHDGLLEPLDYAWEETGASNLGLIIGGVVGVAAILLVAVIIGTYLYKKHKKWLQSSINRAASKEDRGRGDSSVI